MTQQAIVRVVAAAALALSACHDAGQYTWVDSYREAHGPGGQAPYMITRGDVLSVRVWNQDSISGRVRVRSDGMISIPFVNDVEAAGLEPADLARRLQVKLKDYIVTPVVSVSVEEPVPLEISVVGEVAHPGVYRLDGDARVLKALASAGGFTQVADRDRIFVLREEGTPESRSQLRIRFTYDALSRGQGGAAKFRLRPGDVVVVE